MHWERKGHWRSLPGGRIGVGGMGAKDLDRQEMMDTKRCDEDKSYEKDL